MEKSDKTIIITAVLIMVILTAGFAVWRIAFYIPEPAIAIESDHSHYKHTPAPSVRIKTTKPQNAVRPVKPVVPEILKPPNPVSDKKTLREIIRQARSWQPAFTSWTGRKAPDFRLTDINGKKHSLSDYRGKNVLLVFWATWCGPCVREIPELIELRKKESESELAILAISQENPATVKRFVSSKKINYTILIQSTTLSKPYSMVRSIPSSIFIDAEGKIKIGTTGLISRKEIKAILEAEQ